MNEGARTTAASYLLGAGPNLTILTNSLVAKVLFTDKQATGICTVDGQEFYAKRDVILSGGAINTPQLLLLSGIGPADEIAKHDIEVLHDLPDVGKHLQDHVFSGVTLIQKPGTNDRMTYETNPEAQLAAKAQHTKDKTGVLNSLYCSVPMGWFKNEAISSSSEFDALDSHTKEHIKKPTLPMIELATVSPPS
jgi:choline dehydrogenase-like flavoprotein